MERVLQLERVAKIVGRRATERRWDVGLQHTARRWEEWRERAERFRSRGLGAYGAEQLPLFDDEEA